MRSPSAVRLRTPLAWIALLAMLVAAPLAAAPKAKAPKGMRAIPAGTFVPGLVSEDEGGRRAAVTVPAFALDRFEVTAKEYARCVKDGACTTDGTDGEGCNLGVAERGDHPMNCVRQEQAAAYCAWAGRRLPHEWEWEWAGRGPKGGPYPWGAADGTCAQTWAYLGDDSCATSGTQPVGKTTKGASPFGVEGMGGNVSEWLTAADGSGTPVYRGGAYGFYPHVADVRRRVTSGWDTPLPTLGFRCAADLGESSGPSIVLGGPDTLYDPALTGDILSQVLPRIGPAPRPVVLEPSGPPVALAKVGDPARTQIHGFGSRLLATSGGLHEVDPKSGATKEVAEAIDAHGVSGGLLAVAHEGRVRILDAALKEANAVDLTAFVPEGSRIGDVRVSRDGRRVAIVAERPDYGMGPATVFDATGKELWKLSRLDNHSVALNGDGSVLLTSIGYGRGEEKGCYSEIELPSDGGGGGFHMLDDDHVVAVFADREATSSFLLDAWVLPRPPTDAWRPMPGRYLDWEVRRIAGGLGFPIALDPRTSWLAANTAEGLKIVHLRSRHVVAHVPLKEPTSVAFLTDPDRLVVLAGGELHPFALSDVPRPEVPDFHFTRYLCEHLTQLGDD